MDSHNNGKKKFQEQLRRGVTLSPTTAPKASSILVGLNQSPPSQHVQEQVNPLANLSDRAASAARGMCVPCDD